MNRDEARQAVTAFLDQFIERGAAPDVIALRDDIRPGAVRDALECWLSSDDPSEFVVYEAMRRLFWTRAVLAGLVDPPESLEVLYHWTRIEKDGLSSDPAQWEDWLNVLQNLGLHVPTTPPSASPADPPKVGHCNGSASRLTLREAMHTARWEDGNTVRHPEAQYLWFEVDGSDLRERIPIARGMLTALNRAWLTTVPDAIEVLLGNGAVEGLQPGRIPIYVCELCGDLACGAVTAKLIVRTDVVVWTQFRWENGYETPEAISEAPDEIVFDAAEYRTAIASALPQVSLMPFDELEYRGRRFLWPWQWGWRLPKA